MSIVKVIKNKYTAEPLYQWDRNQVLQVYGLSLTRVPEVHFTNTAMSRAIVRQARMDAAGVVTVDVPNSLLQKPYPITAYICGYNGMTFETDYKLKIPVKERHKPADYTLTNDPEVYSFNALENAVVNALHDLSNAEGKLDAATGDLKDAEAVLQQAVKDIDNTVNESLLAALPGFLDDTLTDPNKAAQAAAVNAEIEAAVGTRARAVAGSYTGTGVFGVDNPNTLTFDFAPKLIMFFGSDGAIMPVYGGASVTPEEGMIFNPQLFGTDYRSGPPYYHPNTGQQTMSKRSSDGKTISWYTKGDSASMQYNTEGGVYHYIAIG